MSKEKTYVYLDSNIILDIIRNRRKKSVHLIEKVRNKEFGACTSLFCLLELIDKQQEYLYSWKMLRDGHSFDDILRRRNQRNLNEHELFEAFEKIDSAFTSSYKN